VKPKKIIKNALYLINRNSLSRFAYNHEITKRAKLPLTDIKALAQDISMFSPFTSEIHPPNDWYGHAHFLKQYLGLPQNYKFKFIIEHGVYLTDQVSDAELETDFPTVLTSSEHRIKVYQKYDKKAFNIGPFIHYAPHFYSEEMIVSEKKRLGKNILVFPSHSLKDLVGKYDNRWFINNIKKISKGYNKIRFCLYWIDIQKGFHKFYQDLGFECVSAGHILDPNFVPRLKSLIEISDLTVSNDASTHVGYCVYMNKPHIIFHKFPKLETTDKWRKLTLDFWSSKPYKETLGAFSVVNFKITPKQRQVIRSYFGSKAEVKTKEEFNNLIKLTEKIYRQN
jgi:hypothetical protein